MKTLTSPHSLFEKEVSHYFNILIIRLKIKYYKELDIQCIRESKRHFLMPEEGLRR